MAGNPKVLSEQLISPSLRGSKGSILLIALWSLCLLTIFAVYLGFGARQEIALIKALDSRDSLHFIAEAGARQGIAQLVKEDPSLYYDALNESWSSDPGTFKDINIGYGSFNVGYSYIDYKSGQEQTRYGLIDEERKLNLNNAELAEITQLLMIVVNLGQTEAESVAAAIVDWRDSDDAVSIPSGSAEDRYYRNLPAPYEAKDAEFQVFDELLLVKGMNQQIFEKLKNCVTIYGSGRININTAGIEVLLALNLENDLVSKILSFRYGEDGLEATADDNIFDSLIDIISDLNTFYELSVEETAALSNLISAGKISTRSDNFMIRVSAQLDKRKSQLICVANREGEILSWREE